MEEGWREGGQAAARKEGEKEWRGGGGWGIGREGGGEMAGRRGSELSYYYYIINNNIIIIWQGRWREAEGASCLNYVSTLAIDFN